MPSDNLPGEAKCGFVHLLSEPVQERLPIAISAQAAAQRADDEASGFVRDRRAFGKAIVDFRNMRFTPADRDARLQIGRAHIERAIARHIAGRLTAADAAKAKLWHTETQWLICDAALQLHGGGGCMNEYPIARIWRDARVRRISGGSSEIMKGLIGRSLWHGRQSLTLFRVSDSHVGTRAGRHEPPNDRPRCRIDATGRGMA